MSSGVLETSGNPVTVSDEIDDLVVEVGRSEPDAVSICAPFVSAACRLSQRPAEGKVSRQCLVDRGVVPGVPEPVIEPPDQVGDLAICHLRIFHRPATYRLKAYGERAATARDAETGGHAMINNSGTGTP